MSRGFITPSDKARTKAKRAKRAMGKERFRDSKDRVLSFLAGLIQVDPAELSRTAKEAA